MAAVNFPNNPSVNDTHTSSGSTWKWDGGVWQRLGVAGPQGSQGVQGAQGHQGRQGSVGIASLTIATSPPGSPDAGDMWWDSDDGDLHLYYNDGNSSQWANINNGPAGAQGAQGATGAQGHQGVQGAQGHQGRQGAAGAQGAQGHQGVQGTAGTNANADKIEEGNSYAEILDTGSNGIFRFLPEGTEKFRISTDGNVNFGSYKSVAFPSGTGIQVYSSANPRIKLVNDTTGNSGTDGTQLYLSSSDFILDNKDSGSIIFHTNAAEKVRITSAGGVGIGTAAPENMDSGARSLVVCGPGGTAGQSGITIASGSDKYGSIYFADGTGSASYRGRVEYRHDNDELLFGAGAAHGDLILDANGDLFLRGDSTCYIVMGSSGDSTQTGANNNMNWIRGNGTYVQYNTCGGYHAWEVGGSQKMMLEADGDLVLDSKSQCRITLGSDGTPGGNDSNWIRGDSNNLMFNCADTSGEHIFEVAGAATAKINPGKGVRAENTCKAWVCYKHDGGVSAIHDSFFVTSVSDEGTGIFSIQFAGDMGTEDAIAYQVGSHNWTPMIVGGIAYTPSYGSQNPWWSMEDDWCRIHLQRIDTQAMVDSEWWNLTAHGDAKT